MRCVYLYFSGQDLDQCVLSKNTIGYSEEPFAIKIDKHLNETQLIQQTLLMFTLRVYLTV